MDGHAVQNPCHVPRSPSRTVSCWMLAIVSAPGLDSSRQSSRSRPAHARLENAGGNGFTLLVTAGCPKLDLQRVSPEDKICPLDTRASVNLPRRRAEESVARIMSKAGVFDFKRGERRGTSRCKSPRFDPHVETKNSSGEARSVHVFRPSGTDVTDNPFEDVFPVERFPTSARPFYTAYEITAFSRAQMGRCVPTRDPSSTSNSTTGTTPLASVHDSGGQVRRQENKRPTRRAMAATMALVQLGSFAWSSGTTSGGEVHHCISLVKRLRGCSVGEIPFGEA